MMVDSPILGGAGLGAFMADPLFSEDDSSIVTTNHFSLCDPEETGLALFGAGDSGDVKADYNWDNCFGSLEDVDNLLSSDPDSAFGAATPSPVTLQWDDPSSPLDLQSESDTKSSSIMPVETAKVNFFDPKLEFVPANNATFNEFEAPTSFDSEAKQQQSGGGQVNSSEYLDDEKMMEVLTGSLSTSEIRDNPSKGDSGPSSLSVSDSEKAKVAQAYRARRHAVNRKRVEERTKRQLNHRKIFQAAAYGPHALQPMSMHMPAQLHQPPIQGYPVNAPALLPLQPMIRPYVRVGYNPPPLHVIPQVVPPQYVGYQQFPPPYQLRPPASEVPILPPQPSTPTMTPQEKIEKLKFLQQMQARFAVEQQQQQFAAQGITPLDTGGLCKGVVAAPFPSVKEVEVDVKPTETVVPVSDSEFEPSLSVGQTSMDVTSDDEGGTFEAAVLEQLQNTIKTQLELGTRMCIRDALYRLARSAMRRQASSSGRPTGGDGANISQGSQDADATSSGLEASINSDPSSSSRVSRMDMNGVETQTNPIDRSIAHLLFHKMEPQATPAQVDISRPIGPTVWNQGRNWTAPEMQQPGTGMTQLPPPMAPVSRIQDGAEQQQRSGLSSEAAVRESGELPAPNKQPVKMRNGVQKKLLQRAIGLQELSQVLAQDVAAKEESGCPPVSTSSGSSECQAGVFLQVDGGDGEKSTAMDESG